MVLGVLVLHILVSQNQVLEVHVDIRHTDTVGIQETLEQKIVFDRIQICNAQTVCNRRACCTTTPGTYEIAGLAGCGNIVLNDEEVIRKTHPGYCLELEIQPFRLLVGERVAVSFLRALIGDMTKIGHGMAEFVTAVISLHLIAILVLLDRVTALGNYILVLFEIDVDILHEFGIDLVFGQHVIPVYGI